MTKRLNIALAQLNFMLGDVQGNTHKIIASAHKTIASQSCDIIAYPELALSGYPPEDLLLRDEFFEHIDAALDKLYEQNFSAHLLIGHPIRIGDQIYNAASLIKGNKLIARYHKHHLPNYAVFDEKRYFNAGQDNCVVDINGVKVALVICGDVWEEGIIRQVAQAGADVVLCINASPFHMLKPEQRLNILHLRQRQEAALPMFYVNMVGGQDELVFDGGSFAIDERGNVVHQLPLFEEQIHTITFPFSQQAQTVSLADYSSEWRIYNALVLGTKDYTDKNGFPNVIIGLSGGIDSALTLCIAVDALGAERVTAVLMPSRFTADMSTIDAIKLCENLGVSYHTISIEDMFQSFLSGLGDLFQGLPFDTTEENIQARCRGIILMAISNKMGALVLTTGNKSELAVGYATLYGDMAGGFAVIKDVLKTQVFELCHYRNSITQVIPQRVINRPPSAELRADQTDQDTLPEYAVLDEIITRHVEHNQSILKMEKAGCDKKIAERVVLMIERNEYKRRQAPPGIRVSRRAFGRDWRYPITSAFGRQHEED